MLYENNYIEKLIGIKGVILILVSVIFVFKI